jgi:hypothetical protein
MSLYNDNKIELFLIKYKQQIYEKIIQYLKNCVHLIDSNKKIMIKIFYATVAARSISISANGELSLCPKEPRSRKSNGLLLR